MFTFRFFDFTDPSQESPGHPNYKALTEPRPVEREVFNRYLAYIEGNSKLKVDRDRIKWTYLKEVHPRDHNILVSITVSFTYIHLNSIAIMTVRIVDHLRLREVMAFYR